MRSISSSKTSDGKFPFCTCGCRITIHQPRILPAPVVTGAVMRLHPTGHRRLSTLDQVADIPEEEIWLQKQKSARIRRVYQLDVQHFMLHCPSPRRPSSTHPVSRNRIRNLGDAQVIGRGDEYSPAPGAPGNAGGSPRCLLSTSIPSGPPPSGHLAEETSDGETRWCDPGAVVLAEDTFGKGPWNGPALFRRVADVWPTQSGGSTTQSARDCRRSSPWGACSAPAASPSARPWSSSAPARWWPAVGARAQWCCVARHMRQCSARATSPSTPSSPASSRCRCSCRRK
jgi:hypothetical protein